MRISDLSRETGVPVATLKFYLREGLLHEGERTSATQARYDASHVARVQLIRALTGPGGLSVATAREVLGSIDRPPPSTHDLLGHAHRAVHRAPEGAVDLDDVQQLMSELGWQVDPEHAGPQAEVAAALDALKAAGFELPEGMLRSYAEAMFGLAERELAAVPTDSPAAAVRYVVLGTVLVEPLLLALRRMAQQEASARRFGAGPEARGSEPRATSESVT